MEQHFIQTEGGAMHYYKWGRGNRVLIALHGYGADAIMFENLAQELKESFTIYAVDLPFHGLTQWQHDRYNAKDIAQVIYLILKRENANNCSFLGHSFGAKIAMKLLEYIGNQVDTLYLLSPDGIGTRWLNWSQIIPRGLRRAVVANADFLMKCVKWLNDRNLIPFFVEWFLRKHLSTKEDKRRLLYTWLSFDSFIIKGKRLQELIKRNFIKLVIIIGNRDKLLKIEQIEQFAAKLSNAKLYKIEANHLLNVNEVAEIILANITISPEHL